MLLSAIIGSGVFGVMCGASWLFANAIAVPYGLIFLLWSILLIAKMEWFLILQFIKNKNIKAMIGAIILFLIFWGIMKLPLGISNIALHMSMAVCFVIIGMGAGKELVGEKRETILNC